MIVAPLSLSAQHAPRNATRPPGLLIVRLDDSLTKRLARDLRHHFEQETWSGRLRVIPQRDLDNLTLGSERAPYNFTVRDYAEMAKLVRADVVVGLTATGHRRVMSAAALIVVPERLATRDPPAVGKATGTSAASLARAIAAESVFTRVVDRLSTRSAH
jgi:hypothetical protein